MFRSNEMQAGRSPDRAALEVLRLGDAQPVGACTTPADEGGACEGDHCRTGKKRSGSAIGADSDALIRAGSQPGRDDRIRRGKHGHSRGATLDHPVYGCVHEGETDDEGCRGKHGRQR
jgi:hypothetical protein